MSFKVYYQNHRLKRSEHPGHVLCHAPTYIRVLSRDGIMLMNIVKGTALSKKNGGRQMT